MPFPDEPFARSVAVVPYRPEWASEGADLVARLAGLLPDADAVDHIGSTAIPGMPAKDCLDVMVRVSSVTAADLTPLTEAGYRERPEAWNRSETLDGVVYSKRVYAPPAGGRPVNIHIRESCTPTSRYALLFRDYLRADPAIRNTWGGFKTRLADTGPDLHTYGQVKAAAQPLLIALAEHWASTTCWQP